MEWTKVALGFLTDWPVIALIIAFLFRGVIKDGLKRSTGGLFGPDTDHGDKLAAALRETVRHEAGGNRRDDPAARHQRRNESELAQLAASAALAIREQGDQGPPAHRVEQAAAVFETVRTMMRTDAPIPAGPRLVLEFDGPSPCLAAVSLEVKKFAAAVGTGAVAISDAGAADFVASTLSVLDQLRTEFTY